MSARHAVPVEWVNGLATALEGIAAQARTATEIDNGSELDLLARHLRHVAKVAHGHRPLGQTGIVVDDWRLALLRRTVSRSNGVSLSEGNLGFHVRGLAVSRDTPAVSIDELLTDLVLLAVEERLKAEAARAAGVAQERVDAGQRVAEAQGAIGALEQRALEAEQQADELYRRVSSLTAELAREREKTAFLRTFVPDDVADEADGKRASDAKQRVDTGIYARTRADGSVGYQVTGTKTRPSATFDSLDEAIAYRDGEQVAA